MELEGFVVQKETDPAFQKAASRRAIFAVRARSWMTGVLALSDLLGLMIAFLAAVQIRNLPLLAADPDYVQIFVLLAVTLLIAFSRRSLYPAVGLSYVEELQHLVSSTNFSFFILIGVTFLLKNTAVYSRLILLFTWILSLVLIPGIRFLVRGLMIRLGLWGEPVIIIGRQEQARSLVDYFKTNPHLGIRPVAVLFDAAAAPHPVSEHANETIKEYARSLSIETALVLIEDMNTFDTLVGNYRFVFERVILVKYKNGKFALNRLHSLDFSDVLGLQIQNNLLSPVSQFFKRVTDLVVAGLGLALLSPFFLLIALAIKVDAPGRVFYRQKRLGRHGREFVMLKFRTMYVNAQEVLNAALERNTSKAAEWRQFQKLRNDPRITRVGKWLRKFSLDELPQLWNVLLGEMSLVGPRPIMVDQRESYGEIFKEYIQVAPGMTGLWQVSGRNQTTFARRAELDDEYIQRWSSWLDIYIMIKTVWVVFGRDGAF